MSAWVGIGAPLVDPPPKDVNGFFAAATLLKFFVAATLSRASTSAEFSTVWRR